VTEPFFARMTDKQLMSVRMKDLGLTLEGTWLADCVKNLYQELGDRGVKLRPHIWLSDEWFSPEDIPGFAVPFYLAHPRLRRLEVKQFLDAEGSSRTECMRIMRHETGHAVQHAYDLHKRKRWQELFGKSSTPYPEFYRPVPASKRFVQHLRLWYAQSHPDEDFAETFAVWLTPKSDWRRRYAGWPALRKLEYVNELMAEIADEKPKLRSKRTIDPIHTIKKTIGEHYDEKRDRYIITFPNTYDGDLLRIFSNAPQYKGNEAASRFLTRNRAEIRRMVARWTGEYQHTLDAVLEDMIGRCKELKLRVISEEKALVIDFSVLLTVKTMRFLYSHGRRDWIAL